MSDVNCPYCGKGQKINHDGGYGYQEGIDYEQNCFDCCKTFKFKTSIIISHEATCNDDHILEDEPIKHFPDHKQCSRCDYYELGGRK